MAALKTHVDLAEALEIEAIKCVAGDARHVYQEWYPKYAELQRKRRAANQGASAALDDVIDPAAAAAELEMVHQAISETEAMLAEHRLALIANRPSPYSDEDIDAAHEVLESLRANLPLYESAVDESEVSHGDSRR